MVQILGFFDEVSFNMINGLFGIVAKIYNVMLDIIRTGNIDTSPFDDFITTMYVLAGVFMLFRVVIGMIQMLINPDQMTDKQAGAGKLITRIVVSIVMLMLFVPNGIIFGEDGIFQRVEQALLAEDGLVSRLSGMNFDEDLSSPITKEGTEKFLIENVYADTKADLTCYYFNVKNHSQTIQGGGAGTYREIKLTVNDVYKIEFYKTSNVTGSAGDQTGNLNCSSEKCKYSYVIKSSQNIAGNAENGKYSSLNGNIAMGDAFSESFPTKCPKYLEKKTSSSGSTYYSAQKKHSSKNEITECYKKNARLLGKIKPKSKEGKCYNSGIMGGYSSLSEARTNINKVLADKKNSAKRKYVVHTTNKWIKNISNFVNPGEGSGEISYLNGVSYEAIVFAQGTASSLQECSSGHEDECSEAQQAMFISKDGNEKVIELMDKKVLDIGFIMSMITGLGLIIYLLFLCVEILIRRLKLYFLEVIAPIPVISYVDPKDKVFNQWTKMYLSTYVDLFIKLISIGIAITLLDAVFSDDFWSESNLLMKFFYIVAILAFAKILPTMVSKLFGLDSMGGSFKDIMGMAKGAAGFAVGGALGAGAGMLATGAGIASAKGVKGKLGAGLQGLGSIASGTIKGAGAGSKGKIGTGASGVLATGKRQRDARAQGATMMGMLGSRMANTLGFDDAYTKEKDAVDKLKRKKSNTSGALSSIKTFNDTVESNMRNKSGAKGYENLAEVQTWRQAKAALESAKQSGNADDIYKAEQAEQTAFKHAFDAAKDEELNRIAGLESRDTDGKLVKFSADEKARSSINAYDRYNSELGENAQINSKALNHSTLGQTKDNLTRIESTQQTEITTRETALEESKIKAEHDAVQRGKQ